MRVEPLGHFPDERIVEGVAQQVFTWLVILTGPGADVDNPGGEGEAPADGLVSGTLQLFTPPEASLPNWTKTAEAKGLGVFEVVVTGDDRLPNGVAVNLVARHAFANGNKVGGFIVRSET